MCVPYVQYGEYYGLFNKTNDGYLVKATTLFSYEYVPGASGGKSQQLNSYAANLIFTVDQPVDTFCFKKVGDSTGSLLVGDVVTVLDSAGAEYRAYSYTTDSFGNDFTGYLTCVSGAEPFLSVSAPDVSMGALLSPFIVSAISSNDGTAVSTGVPVRQNDYLQLTPYKPYSGSGVVTKTPVAFTCRSKGASELYVFPIVSCTDINNSTTCQETGSQTCYNRHQADASSSPAECGASGTTMCVCSNPPRNGCKPLLKTTLLGNYYNYSCECYCDSVTCPETWQKCDDASGVCVVNIAGGYCSGNSDCTKKGQYCDLTNTHTCVDSGSDNGSGGGGTDNTKTYFIVAFVVAVLIMIALLVSLYRTSSSPVTTT
jgi:hypothetical protein